MGKFISSHYYFIISCFITPRRCYNAMFCQPRVYIRFPTATFNPALSYKHFIDSVSLFKLTIVIKLLEETEIMPLYCGI